MEARHHPPTTVTAFWAIVSSTPFVTLVCFAAAMALLMAQPVSRDLGSETPAVGAEVPSVGTLEQTETSEPAAMQTAKHR